MHAALARSAVVLVLAGSLPACASADGREEPRGLGYDRPDPDPVTYTFSDTAAFAIATAMGEMEVITARAGTAELDFRHWQNARVSVRFPRFQGSFRNPMQGSTSVDTSDIDGAFTVRLDRAGGLTVVDTPGLSPALLDIAGPESLIRSLFVHLPARPVTTGARWVDTVRTAEQAGGTRSVARSVVTSTLVGDTVVAGRQLLRIRTQSESTIEVSGVSGGVRVEQELSGTLTGTVLWDEAARALFRRVSQGELTGTLALPDAGVEPMAVRAALRRSVSLRP